MTARRARVDRLLDLLWEADRFIARLELTREDAAQVQAYTHAGRTYYRGVPVIEADRSAAVVREPGGALAYPLPDPAAS